MHYVNENKPTRFASGPWRSEPVSVVCESESEIIQNSRWPCVTMVSWMVIVNFICFVWKKCVTMMADLSVDISKLPDEIRDKLAELDLELSEGKNAVSLRTYS